MTKEITSLKKESVHDGFDMNLYYLQMIFKPRYFVEIASAQRILV